MKKASLLMMAVLLLSGAMAAQQAEDRTKEAERLAASTRAEAQHEPGFRSNVCFTMRSYLFARSDGEAPRLVGMTTCTPGTRYRLYHAQKNLQFGLYPAVARQPENSAPTEPQQ